MIKRSKGSAALLLDPGETLRWHAAARSWTSGELVIAGSVKVTSARVMFLPTRRWSGGRAWSVTLDEVADLAIPKRWSLPLVGIARGDRLLLRTQTSRYVLNMSEPAEAKEAIVEAKTAQWRV